MALEVRPESNRLDAIFRLALLLVYAATLWLVVLAIGLIGGIVFMIIDVILQLVRGDSGYSMGSSMLSMWAVRLFRWPLSQLEYIIGTKKDGFPLLP